MRTLSAIAMLFALPFVVGCDGMSDLGTSEGAVDRPGGEYVNGVSVSKVKEAVSENDLLFEAWHSDGVSLSVEMRARTILFDENLDRLSMQSGADDFYTVVRSDVFANGYSSVAFNADFATAPCSAFSDIGCLQAGLYSIKIIISTTSGDIVRDNILWDARDARLSRNSGFDRTSVHHSCNDNPFPQFPGGSDIYNRITYNEPGNPSLWGRYYYTESCANNFPNTFISDDVVIELWKQGAYGRSVVHHGGERDFSGFEVYGYSSASMEDGKSDHADHQVAVRSFFDSAVQNDGCLVLISEQCNFSFRSNSNTEMRYNLGIDTVVLQTGESWGWRLLYGSVSGRDLGPPPPGDPDLPGSWYPVVLEEEDVFIGLPETYTPLFVNELKLRFENKYWSYYHSGL